MSIPISLPQTDDDADARESVSEKSTPVQWMACLGLLAVIGWVFWPTQARELPVRALSQQDGSQEYAHQALGPVRLRHLRPGNMAFGNAALVVAGADEVAGYVAR